MKKYKKLEIKAKEMFKELGYIEKINTFDKIRYERTLKGSGTNVYEMIEIGKKDKFIWKSISNVHYSIEFDKEEFEAIQKQIEELGWE